MSAFSSYAAKRQQDIDNMCFFFAVQRKAVFYIAGAIAPETYDIITAKQLLYARLCTECADAVISDLAVGDGNWSYYILSLIHISG